MSKETLQNEPHIALFGGEKTGFELYEELIKQLFEIKKTHIIKTLILVIEIGFDQYEYSNLFLSNLGLEYKYYKDNSGIVRCIKIIM